MEQTSDVRTAPKTDQEYAAAIDELIAEMKVMAEQMESKQRNIERLRAETRAMLDETNVLLDKLAAA